MKKVVTLLLLMAASPLANAALITDTVNVDNWFNNLGETRSWTHDITDNGYTLGANISSAVLSFDFYDDGGRDGRDQRRVCIFFFCAVIPGNYETAVITIEDFDLEDGGVFEIGNEVLNQGVGPSGIDSLLNDGLLNVSVTRITGDFGLRSVELAVEANPVPAPSVIVLISLGLVAVPMARRRKARSYPRSRDLT